ncbi:Cytochrome P450 [Mycena chlorophos]|uniref:Cytochrome P450 n=1 Tax=Mycena chlorophos TaxID=658473 RepID=A0A8H6S4U6_MYCCL|nr:Cytochrome P450 [Mycena chlorophos]
MANERYWVPPPTALEEHLRHFDPKNSGSLYRGSQTSTLKSVLTRGMSTPQTPSRTSSSSSTGTAPATPHHRASDDSEAVFRRTTEVQAAVLEELQDAWIEESAALEFQTHLADLADALMAASEPNLTQSIETWLQNTPLYDWNTGQWRDIPTGGLEKELYEPLVAVLSGVLARFGGEECTNASGTVIGRRQFINTHNVLLEHNHSDLSPEARGPLRSMPDILCLGTGPSATPFVDFPPRIAYNHTKAIWEGKTKNTFGDDEKKQIAMYARETFVAQPNRRHVSATMISFDRLRVLRFDRAGCYYTGCIDYHEKAVLFVKIVLVLSAFNEDVVGFDTSVYWENKHRMMRFTPSQILDRSVTPNKLVPNSTELVFELESKALFARRTIRSRGTVCWVATYRDRTKTYQFIVKDYWRAEDRTHETTFLSQLVDVPGVAQLFAYIDDRESVCEARDVVEIRRTDGDRISDRFFMRVVIPAYGGTLEKALTPLALLRAVEAIVRGHRESVIEHWLLHRDISHTNLRLSPYRREQGVMIDWDLAKEVEEEGLTLFDLRTGTIAFHSLKIHRANPEKLGPPDHMDDLESIFYVVFNVLCNYDAKGKLLPASRTPTPLQTWLDPTVPSKQLGESKGYFLLDDLEWPVTRYPQKEQSEILFHMLEDFRREIFEPRARLVKKALNGQAVFPRYQPQTAADDYDKFEGILRRAIDALECVKDTVLAAVEPASGAEPQATPTASRVTVPSPGLTPKRRRFHDDNNHDHDHDAPVTDSEPPRKRSTPTRVRNPHPSPEASARDPFPAPGSLLRSTSDPSTVTNVSPAAFSRVGAGPQAVISGNPSRRSRPGLLTSTSEPIPRFPSLRAASGAARDTEEDSP